MLPIFGKVPDPVEHCLRRDPQEEGNAVHVHATQIPQDSVDLRREGLATRGGTGKLISTLLALLLRLACGRAIFDYVATLAFGALLHPSLLQKKFYIVLLEAISQRARENATTTYLKLTGQVGHPLRFNQLALAR